MKKDTIANRKKLKRKAEALLHKYIRLRAKRFDDRVECYTCRKLYPIEQIHAGHYRHGKLDLDPRNLKPQCAGDNTYRGGLLNKYALHLIDDYGCAWVKKLEEDADRDTGQYSYEFLINFIAEYKALLAKL